MMVSSQPVLSSGLSKQMRNAVRLTGTEKDEQDRDVTCDEVQYGTRIITFTCHSNDVHYLNCHKFMFNYFNDLYFC